MSNKENKLPLIKFIGKHLSSLPPLLLLPLPFVFSVSALSPDSPDGRSTGVVTRLSSLLDAFFFHRQLCPDNKSHPLRMINTLLFYSVYNDLAQERQQLQSVREREIEADVSSCIWALPLLRTVLDSL